MKIVDVFFRVFLPLGPTGEKVVFIDIGRRIDETKYQ